MKLNALKITILAGSLWAADRLFRLSLWAYFAFGNYCTLTPLSTDTTKVTLHRSLLAGRPGSHAFVWIPGVRAFEAHPFTMVSNEPVEFLVKAHDGFTKALYRKACDKPGKKLRATIDGPYGNAPDLDKNYDRLLLVAGGSGVTFTMALALAWARKQRDASNSSFLDFVWVVRDPGEHSIRYVPNKAFKYTDRAHTIANFEWFNAELGELLAHPRVNVHLYATGKIPQAITEKISVDVASSIEEQPQVEKVEADTKITMTTTSPRSSSTSLSSGQPLRSMNSGRPDMSSLLGIATAGLGHQSKVLVAGESILSVIVPLDLRPC
jgi:ferredoxin-NADP reductase